MKLSNPLDILRLKEDYRAVFENERGKRVLADILARAGVTRPRFVEDPYRAAFFEGQRHFAMSIFRFVHKYDKLPDMIAAEIDELEKESKQ